MLAVIIVVVTVIVIVRAVASFRQGGYMPHKIWSQDTALAVIVISFCFYSEEPVKQQKTVLERWEESLLACTSFSQVFVHLNTLDQSITWSKSVLNARCRLCRRKGDAEHMLLCDGCDRGHHMYCLKPPITEVRLTAVAI